MRDQRVTQIAIEGIDGCGKDLQLRFLHEALERRSYHIIRKREPSADSALGKFIREQINVNVGFQALSDSSLSVLFAADRIMQWWSDTVKLDRVGQGLSPYDVPIILSNRCVASAYAYHGIDNPMHEYLSPPEVWPDLVVVLRVTLETATARLRERSSLDRFEQQARLGRVAPAYEQLESVCPQRTTVLYVEADGDEFTVATQVLGKVEEWLTEQMS